MISLLAWKKKTEMSSDLFFPYLEFHFIILFLKY